MIKTQEVIFKVGDRVKRIKGFHLKMKVNDEDVIVSISRETCIDLNYYGKNHDLKNFELVQPLKTNNNLSNMTNEELIAEIKNRYPEGTIINSLGGTHNVKVVYTNKNFYWEGNMFRIDKNCALYDQRVGGMWAKIVKSVESQIINNYQIF